MQRSLDNSHDAVTTAVGARDAATEFGSILFDQDDGEPNPDVPEYFRDLNLDRIMTSLVAGREEYDLAPFFIQSLHDIDTVEFRQDILADLQSGPVNGCVTVFADRMRASRASTALAITLRERFQKERYFLDAVDLYCEAVQGLRDDLLRLDVDSRGMRGLRDYLDAHVTSPTFRAMTTQTQSVREGLAGVRYSIHTSGLRVTVARYEAEADYSAEVLETFKKFEQGAVKDHHTVFHEQVEANGVEAMILERVAQLFPEEFGALEAHYARYRGNLDATVLRFDREVQFYLGYLDYVQRFVDAGLQFCRPVVSPESKEVSAEAAFDLALADKLLPEKTPVVSNDFSLTGAERIFVVSGPNQGGKTTFARMFGQVHYLASLGLIVPAKRAQLYLFDRLFTHFEKEEDLSDFSGKLEDDLIRAKSVFARATPASIIVMNEIFTSTTLEDALFLGTKLIDEVTRLGALCVYVTFVDELASLNEATVSMVSTVVPDDPAQRTYKVVRKPADGLSFAIAIAQKYGLTYERLKKRIDK